MTSSDISSTHNGPICGTCGARYVGSFHSCSQADILRRVQELLLLVERLNTSTPVSTKPLSTTRGCSCRPENGGSGICGCILSGPRVTCSAAS